MIAAACPKCGASAPVEGEARAAVCAKCGEALPVPVDDGRTVPPSQGSSLPGEERAASSPQGAGAVTANLGSAAPTGEPAQDTADLCACLAPPQASDELGRLGQYRVLRIIGAGGMGVVFEAEDLNLNRRVALKALLPTLGASATARRRFLREARAAAEVESDHVVAIYQTGEDRGVPYLVMPFLKGETLDDRARREPPLPMSEVLRIGREIALGLDAAHAKGLVHRDVKPSNTWLEAGTGRVKILDFGLARSTGEESDLTRQGAILGTPAYMSPEQARGLPATFKSDLFSLGSVLYRLCTGKQPFKGNDTVDTLMAVATAVPAPPFSLNAAMPPALDNLIMHLLAKDPNHRPNSARAVADALGMIDPASRAEPKVDLATVPVSALPPVSPVADVRPRHRGWLAASLLVIVALGLFLFGHSLERLRHGLFGTRASASLREVASALDHLDPDQVAAADRIPGLGRELVAVLGSRGGPSVQGVDFSRDGTMLLALGLRFDAHVWDIAGGQERASFNARRAVFAPDGQSLAAAHTDGIRLLDLDGKVTGSVPVPADAEVFAVDFAPDGRTLVWGGKVGVRKKLSRGDGAVHVWDLVEQKEVSVFPTPPHPVYSVRYSPDGKRVAAMTADRSVYVWDVASRKEIKFEQLRGVANVAAMLHSMRASLMDFTPDGRKLAYARRSTVHVVDCESGTETSQLSGFSGNVHAVAYAPDGHAIAVCDARGQIALFDTAGRRLRDWQMPGVVNDVTFAPDSRHLAVANFNGTVAILRIGE